MKIRKITPMVMPKWWKTRANKSNNRMTTIGEKTKEMLDRWDAKEYKNVGNYEIGTGSEYGS